MDFLVNFFQPLDLHPVADHFTVALLTIAVLTDLVASLAPTRAWIRYMALSLTILGALAAAASFATGDMEADRIFKSLGAEAKTVLHRHAELGEYLAIGFGVLALWRILIGSLGFMAGSRPVYLIVALIGIGTLLYAGHLGGRLVYTYGAGTALLTATPEATATAPAAAPSQAGPLPTVTVPTPEPTAAPPPPAASEPKPETSPTPKAEPSEAPKTPEPPAHPAPSASPTASGV
jgi:uncharacterized membrane protein